MALSRTAMLLAFFITLSLFLTVLLIRSGLDVSRERALNAQLEEVYTDFQDLQTISLVSDVYGDEMACISYRNKLRDLDTRLWDLGLRLENYRSASEEFSRSEYYLAQKKLFNEKEFIYLTILTDVKARCNLTQPVISFFYENGRDCEDCDAQSFVLADIKREFQDNIAVFPFDTDLGIPTLSALSEYYDLSGYPCVVINEVSHCGLLDRDSIMREVCATEPNATICLDA